MTALIVIVVVLLLLWSPIIFEFCLDRWMDWRLEDE